MKKFFLTIEQRKLLVERLLCQAQVLKNIRKDPETFKKGEIFTDGIDQGIQEYEQLADLFKVGDFEE